MTFISPFRDGPAVTSEQQPSSDGRANPWRPTAEGALAERAGGDGAPREGGGRLHLPGGRRVWRTSVVFDTYWRFAVERQAVFFRRLSGARPPWTSDAILAAHRFTNAYRASDRVSQYLINRVIPEGEQSPEELFFRILLFKLFNRIETWEYLRSSFGTPRFAEYRFGQYDLILTRALAERRRIYSAAYIMPSPRLGAHRKHANHLRLLERMMADRLPLKLTEAPSLQAGYELLRGYPSLGPFLAFQFTIDCNYSSLLNYSELDFVVPGPGAANGIRKCLMDADGLTDTDVIRAMADIADTQFTRLGLDFATLWGRPLQLVDLQNLFCEVDKYARLAHPEIKGLSGRTRIKQTFQPAVRPLTYRYPPKWGLETSRPILVPAVTGNPGSRQEDQGQASLFADPSYAARCL
jgi:hypothetical protein